ncbi:enoyl-CoA hydratase/isomerase family protein [Afifella pfennigii]|uniref:enoyl-CoA hydratase/isomerase family protein n=1 Tax=Afifella pfennigii TaxID=209897 RepID=UPI0004798EFE|nr:enoyl-CoA hydratase/isomerase family protein [Afifella pfennigii]
MSGTVISTYLGNGVEKISLNRPARLNAICPELLEDLLAAFAKAARDEEVRAILFTGEGRAFCSGDDLKDFSGQVSDEAGTRAYVERIQEVTRAIVRGDKPVVGAVRGWAVGGGLEWVINCDFAVAAENTRFFFPEISWGLFVTGGVTELLPRLVGLQKARELILFGEKFHARQALQWGLLHEVVPDEELMPRALALAERIAALPAGPVRDLKRILAGGGRGLDAAMAEETEATLRGFLDPETARRIAAFGS